MFKRFESNFNQDASENTATIPAAQSIEPRLQDFFERFRGTSFNRGLYRIMAADAFEFASQFTAEAFPEVSRGVVPFSYDWLGRIFALDPARLESKWPAVLILEPGTGKLLQIPANLVTFHENELIDYRDAALASNFHTEWLASGNPPPSQNECVGYKRPLFLGGSDSVGNLELSDLDVYWTISAQLIQKARGLPPGTRIERR